MKRHLLSSILLLALLQAGLAQTKSFVFGGITRSYILHLPDGYTPSKEYPLVLNLHGYTSNAVEQQAYTEMDDVADEHQFIVVYPQGVNEAWNAGVYLNAAINDVGFIDALLDTLIQNYSVNTAKVYSCGMSLGGYMTYRLGCELSGRFAAIASVTGVMASSIAPTCVPSKNLPLLHIHGTADDVVLYQGSTGSMGVEATIQKWVGLDQCSAPPDTTHLPNVDTDDSSTVDLIKYTNCKGDLEVWFYKIYNGGHTWPDGIIDIPNGNTNRDFNASEAIWEFFDRYPTVVSGIRSEVSNKSNIALYPNPVQHSLQIPSQLEGKKASIMDLTGSKLLELEVLGKELSVDFLPKGMYLLQIEGNSSSPLRFVRD